MKKHWKKGKEPKMKRTIAIIFLFFLLLPVGARVQKELSEEQLTSINIKEELTQAEAEIATVEWNCPKLSASYLPRYSESLYPILRLATFQ